jgi:hypothetical protein
VAVLLGINDLSLEDVMDFEYQGHESSGLKTINSLCVSLHLGMADKMGVSILKIMDGVSRLHIRDLLWHCSAGIAHCWRMSLLGMTLYVVGQGSFYRPGLRWAELSV